MAKEKSFGAAVSGRLPMNYGDENLPMTSMKKPSAYGPAGCDAKQQAAGCPHPSANQKEGRAGRQHVGSEKMSVETGHFNKHRAKST